MVAVAGAMMSAVTTTPTGSTGKAADANNPNAAQNAAGGFTQLIAELLGNNAATPTDAASAAVANATSADTDASSADKSSAKDDAALTPEMLALGYPIAYALTPQAPPVPTAQLTGTNAADVATEGVTGNSGTANSDAAQLQQLTQLLAKRGDANTDSANAIAAAKQQGKNDGKSDGNDGSALAALFSTPETASAVTQDKSNELLLKAKDGDDSTASVQSANAHHSAYDQLQQAGLTQTQVRDAATTDQQQYTLHSRMGSHEWTAELGNKLTLMTTQNTQSASLQLTPDNLGPVQVKIEINQNQASVWFSADQADTRAALEQALPKLRELFAAQGMSLTDAGVFGQRSQQQQSSFSNSGQSATGEELGVEAVGPSRRLSIGLLDTYA
jgi:flagellar hook-length control protein FliK